jgi:hypothetical protein
VSSPFQELLVKHHGVTDAMVAPAVDASCFKNGWPRKATINSPGEPTDIAPPQPLTLKERSTDCTGNHDAMARLVRPWQIKPASQGA